MRKRSVDASTSLSMTNYGRASHPERSRRVLQQHLLRWYRKHRRIFLWRKTTDPYEILVSEIMLQQTQVSRVQEKLPVFLKSFPDFPSLAKATKAEVIRAWRGMGYNNRAVRLNELAKIVVEQYDSKLPATIALLEELPGIGKYTSHAVSCFGFRKRVPVVDVNIRRVLSRLFWKMKKPDELKSEKEIWQFAEQILPRDAYTWNQALMELGGRYCKAGRPKCGDCPVEQDCSSRHLGKMKNERRVSTTKEKLSHGLPNRIWRGRIVEALRNVNGEGSISLHRLGKTIKPDYSRNDSLWLESLVNQLSNDGVAQMFKSNSTINVALAEE
ncbi:MAG: A/G-specific adenine glycosylase [Ignavibacteriae bacterium]|nr:A/G-specific adenine glycosylase [Ignavibacteriota bacterium]